MMRVCLQRTLLIEKGVLKNFLADRAGSLRTDILGLEVDVARTIAAAAGCEIPILLQETTLNEDLFASVDKGIYCKKRWVAAALVLQDSSTSVEEAYLIENGSLKPLKGSHPYR